MTPARFQTIEEIYRAALDQEPNQVSAFLDKACEGRAEALVTAGLERLSADYKDESKEKLFNELRIFLTSGAEPLLAYAELAVRLGMTESTLRSHVTRLRARYREALRAEVRRTVDTEVEVGEELHELLRVLTRG